MVCGAVKHIKSTPQPNTWTSHQDRISERKSNKETSRRWDGGGAKETRDERYQNGANLDYDIDVDGLLLHKRGSGLVIDLRRADCGNPCMGSRKLRKTK